MKEIVTIRDMVEVMVTVMVTVIVILLALYYTAPNNARV